MDFDEEDGEGTGMDKSNKVILFLSSEENGAHPKSGKTDMCIEC